MEITSLLYCCLYLKHLKHSLLSWHIIMDKRKGLCWNLIKTGINRNCMNMLLGLYNYVTFIIIHRVNSTHLWNCKWFKLRFTPIIWEYICSLNKVKINFAENTLSYLPYKFVLFQCGIFCWSQYYSWAEMRHW